MEKANLRRKLIGQNTKNEVAQAADQALLESLQAKLELATENGSRRQMAMIFDKMEKFYQTRKQWDMAIVYSQNQLDIYQQYHEHAAIHRLECQIGQLYYKKQDYASALTWFEKALLIARSIDQLELISITHYNISLMYQALDDYASALDHARKVDTLTTNAEANVEIKVGALYVIGHCLKEQRKYDEALEQMEHAIELTPSLAPGAATGLLYSCHNTCGILYYKVQAFTKALSHFQYCRDLALHQNDKEKQLIAEQHIGSVLTVLKDEAGSVEYYEKALAIAKETTNAEMEALALASLARADLDRVDLSEAIRKQELARAAIKYSKTKRIQAFVETCSGNIDALQTAHEQAIQHYEQAQAIAKADNDPYALCLSHRNIGHVYLAQEKYDQAKSVFEEYLKTATMLGDKLELAYAYAGLGLSLRGIEAGKAPESEDDESTAPTALTYFQRQRSLSIELNHLKLQTMAQRYIADNYQTKQQYAEASEEYNTLIRLTTELEDDTLIGQAHHSYSVALSGQIADLNKLPASPDAVKQLAALEAQRDLACTMSKNAFSKLENKENANQAPTPAEQTA